MADDGGWPKGAGSEALASGDERTRQAMGELSGVLGELERRLATSELQPLRAETTAALIQTLEALTRRMARHEAAAQGRARELAATLSSLSQYLEAQAGAQAIREDQLSSRLDRMLSELAQVRAGQVAPRADPPPIRVILATAAAAAALSVVGAGVLAISAPEVLPHVMAAPLAAIVSSPLRPSLNPAPVAAKPARPVADEDGAAATPAGDTLAAVAAALNAGDATALPRLSGLAQAGDAQAQLQLAALYEGGQGGLARDMVAARLWTRRAAESGERVAMHNLALFLAEGDGGVRDTDEAAAWFLRAAERGVVDSQYNLARLYEAGRGVDRNLREAYRWYAIAAHAGDTASRERQVELEARLKAGERAELDRDARAFRPSATATADAAAVIAPAATLAETQALLARKGYYLGPIDGVASQTLKSAAAAYFRDHPGAAPTT